MLNEKIDILWDSAHIWGLMAWRAMRSYGLKCRFIKAIEITQEAAIRKRPCQSPPPLLVPGGGAKLKAKALGAAGRRAILERIARGGAYIGFCGGAGLALSQKNSGEGLNLCPWTRSEYPQRLYHLVSGNVIALDSHSRKMHLPVWWPGRFAAAPDPAIDILATYFAAADDLWLADLPLARIPANIQTILREKFDFDPELYFPKGQPIAIRGRFGQGIYFLSYAHLETPLSPAANSWLAELLTSLGDFHIPNRAVPEWNTMPVDMSNPPASLSLDVSYPDAIKTAHLLFANLMLLGKELRLLFERAPWLWGWRNGAPGMACNNLLAALAILNELPPARATLELWEKEKENFIFLFKNFIENAESFFWRFRLEKTLERPLSLELPGDLIEERNRIFGHPMSGGGSLEKLLNCLEEFIYLSSQCD